jgi:multiple sugar transport system substrate-binding protein
MDDFKHPTRWTFATDPNTALGIQFRADMIHKHRVMNPARDSSDVKEVETRYMFVNGSAAMFISGIWMTPYFREMVRDFPWDVAMVPKGPQGQRGFMMGGSGYGISRRARNKKLAWKFVRFLTGEEGTGKFAGDGLVQPAMTKVAESPVFLDGKDPKNKKMLLDAVRYGKLPALCKNWEEFEAYLTFELDEVWKGRRQVPEALANLRAVLERKPPET